MDANFVYWLNRTEFSIHTFTSGVPGRYAESHGVPIQSSKRLQHGCLAVQEVTSPYFLGEKVLMGYAAKELREEKMTPWDKISNARLIFRSQKTVEIALKKIARQFEWERLYAYVQDCRKKLEANFRQFYLRIQAKQEELKRAELKHQH